MKAKIYYTNMKKSNCVFIILGGRKMQRDSKRWTQFHTSIFPELYMVYE